MKRKWKRMKISRNESFTDPPKRKKEIQVKQWNHHKECFVDLWKEIFDASSLKETRERIITLMNLELEGGRCPYPNCLKAWQHVTKSNMYYSLDYYHPGCYCYYKCPLCGRSNHYEMESGELQKNKYRCQCGWLLMDDKTKKHGLRFEKENLDFLNKLRARRGIYYVEFDGSLVMERIKK